MSEESEYMNKWNGHIVLLDKLYLGDECPKEKYHETKNKVEEAQEILRQVVMNNIINMHKRKKAVA